jgi:hypothetical protein
VAIEGIVVNCLGSYLLEPNTAKKRESPVLSSWKESAGCVSLDAALGAVVKRIALKTSPTLVSLLSALQSSSHSAKPTGSASSAAAASSKKLKIKDIKIHKYWLLVSVDY